MSWVYFLKPIGAEGPVKVGTTRARPESRLWTYSNLSPIPLELVVSTPGAHRLEAQFHTLFREHWSHHEWFHAHPAMTAVIEAIKAGTFDFSTLPEPKALRHRRTYGVWGEKLAAGEVRL